MQQRLSDMGQWLKVNGEAIYATRKWDKAIVNNNTTQYYTRKGKDLYLISTKFPTADLTVTDINKPTKVTMVGLDAPVVSSFKNGKLNIKVPNINPANNPSNYAWVFKLEGVL
jgi:alpha-L-fucosidase